MAIDSGEERGSMIRIYTTTRRNWKWNRWRWHYHSTNRYVAPFRRRTKMFKLTWYCLKIRRRRSTKMPARRPCHNTVPHLWLQAYNIDCMWPEKLIEITQHSCYQLYIIRNSYLWQIRRRLWSLMVTNQCESLSRFNWKCPHKTVLWHLFMK